MIQNAKKALILVDLQNDFCTGGSLAVPEGESVIPLANRLLSSFPVVVASKDWHPADHASFIDLWPTHCVQGSFGAEFHSDLAVDKIHKVIHKGTVPELDSYSAFFDNERLQSTGLVDYLRGEAVAVVYVLGLATDYCVKYTCLDALYCGFEVFLIEDACRGVDLEPGDSLRALEALKAAGVKLVQSKLILASQRPADS